MKRIPSTLQNQRGVAMVVVALLLLLFVSTVGLAVDLGRAYIVKAALASAIDGAALAAARMVPLGQTPARTAAENIFNVNFPAGFLGSTMAPPDIQFGFAPDGSNLITITSTATIPTTFMRVAGFSNINVGSRGQATRRLIDMAFVVDRSGSLDPVWAQVQAAASTFIGKFDQNLDRIALVSYSSNVAVNTPINTPARGFGKAAMQTTINGLVSSGFTATSEGLYQGWNQLKRIPVDNQSSLRAIVLFTDGAPNSFAAEFPDVSVNCGNSGPDGGGQCSPSGGFQHDITGMLVGGDYPQVGSPPNQQGENNPEVFGLMNPYGALNSYVLPTTNSGNWTSGRNVLKTTLNRGIPKMPTLSQTRHIPQAGVGATVFAFPLYDGSLPHQRPMVGTAPYPVTVQNANNAARNVMESVANAIRADTTGAAPIHIFTLGLGLLLEQGTGSDLETGSSMLRRVSNDPTSPDFNSSQPEGAYFFAGSVAQLDAAFEAIRDRIIRINQ